MRAVIDHCMKPQIRDGSPAHIDLWAAGMARLADDTGAFCKLSGLVTEADTDWSAQTLQPYVDHVLDCFGPDRVMWGSDWPVARLRMDYAQWHHLSQQLTQSLNKAGQDQVFDATARQFYRIAPLH